MNDVEKEVLILNYVLEATQDLLSSWLICHFPAKNGVITEVRPKDLIEKKLFAILLLELISDLDGKVISGQRKSAIEHLIDIGNAPKIGGIRLGKKISKNATNFHKWLDKEFEYEFDSAIGKRIKIKLTRKAVIKFCGNRQKHFGFRLGNVVEALTKVYNNAGVKISGSDSITLLEDIDEWFYKDIFAYHFTKICEHVANINNAIFEYLSRVHKKRFKKIDDTFYKFAMPRSVKGRIFKTQFYQLLNRIRSRRRMDEPIIQTTVLLTKRY
jgi:hypothetical protein